jgi:hypothetical protein
MSILHGIVRRGSICEERKMRRSKDSAASRAAMDLSRPTKRGNHHVRKDNDVRSGRSG